MCVICLTGQLKRYQSFRGRLCTTATNVEQETFECAISEIKDIEKQFRLGFNIVLQII